MPTGVDLVASLTMKKNLLICHSKLTMVHSEAEDDQHVVEFKEVEE